MHGESFVLIWRAHAHTFSARADAKTPSVIQTGHRKQVRARTPEDPVDPDPSVRVIVVSRAPIPALTDGLGVLEVLEVYELTFRAPPANLY